MIVADMEVLTLAGLEKEKELASLCDDKLLLKFPVSHNAKRLVLALVLLWLAGFSKARARIRH
jgi:hypothetical protein